MRSLSFFVGHHQWQVRVEVLFQGTFDFQLGHACNGDGDDDANGYENA